MVKSFINFIQLILEKRSLIFSMAKREITTQYVGSLLGFVWTFIHPMVMVSVFWFVFSVGFKSKPMGDVPFVVWLTAGMAPWFMFSDVVLGSVGVVLANGHLIKKTIFPSQILPIIKLLCGSVTHAIFLLVLFGLILFQGMPCNFYYLQVFYYYFCLIVLVLGLSWIVSALNVFVRDIGQIVGVVVQVGFWGTPIFWDINMMPPRIQFLLKLNPMFYIVQGYRDTFIYYKPFWSHPELTLYFWCCALVIFFTGAVVFKKLKTQFADVL